jgi:hypothetical protein
VDPTVGGPSCERVSGRYPAFDDEAAAAATGCGSDDGREHAATIVVMPTVTEIG